MQTQLARRDCLRGTDDGRDVLVGAPTVINVPMWLAFVLGRSVLLHRLSRLRQLAEAFTEPSGAWVPP